jgi:hypothetical protein
MYSGQLDKQTAATTYDEYTRSKAQCHQKLVLINKAIRVGAPCVAIGHFASSRKKFVIGVALQPLLGASFCKQAVGSCFNFTLFGECAGRNVLLQETYDHAVFGFLHRQTDNEHD